MEGDNETDKLESKRSNGRQKINYPFSNNLKKKEIKIIRSINE